MIIFDLDGTLIDSHEGLAYSMNLVLVELGLKIHPHEAYMRFVGNGIRMLVHRALPEGSKDLLEEAYERMMYHYERHFDRGLKVYEGIYLVLDELIDQGHLLALVTNKNQQMAEVIMANFFEGYPFIEIIGVCDANPPKPDPSSILRLMKDYHVQGMDCTIVGDTEVDLIVARNAKIKEIFVTWGFRTLEDVLFLTPKTVIDHPMDLLAYI